MKTPSTEVDKNHRKEMFDRQDKLFKNMLNDRWVATLSKAFKLDQYLSKL